MGFDGGGLGTVRPTSAGHARARREVLQVQSSIDTRRFPEIRFGIRYILRDSAGAVWGNACRGGTGGTLLVDAVWEDGVGFASRIGGWLSRGGARCASLPLATFFDPSGVLI